MPRGRLLPQCRVPISSGTDVGAIRPQTPPAGAGPPVPSLSPRELCTHTVTSTDPQRGASSAGPGGTWHPAGQLPGRPRLPVGDHTEQSGECNTAMCLSEPVHRGQQRAHFLLPLGAPEASRGGSSDLHSAPSAPLLKRQRAGDSPGRFVTRQRSGPHPRGSGSGVPGRPENLGFYTSPGRATAARGPGPRAAELQRCPRAAVGPRLAGYPGNKGVRGGLSVPGGDSCPCPAPWVPRSAVAWAGCVERNIQTMTIQGRGCFASC